MASLSPLDNFYVNASFSQLDSHLARDIKKFKSLQNWETAYKILAYTTFLFIITTPLFLYLAHRMHSQRNAMIEASFHQIDIDTSRKIYLNIRDRNANTSIAFRKNNEENDVNVGHLFFNALKGILQNAKGNKELTLFTICLISHQGIHAPLLNTYGKLDDFATNWMIGYANNKLRINVDITNINRVKVSTVFYSTISYFKEGEVYEKHYKRDRIFYSLARKNITIDSDLILRDRSA